MDETSQARRSALSDDAGQPHAASERIGVPAVDAVLAEIETVGELPVQEQVAVFERAHERLRHALDAPADDAADGPGDPDAAPGDSRPSDPDL